MATGDAMNPLARGRREPVEELLEKWFEANPEGRAAYIAERRRTKLLATASKLCYSAHTGLFAIDPEVLASVLTPAQLESYASTGREFATWP